MRLGVPALVEGTRFRREISDDNEREKEGKERQHDRVKSVKASHDDGEVERICAPCIRSDDLFTATCLYLTVHAPTRASTPYAYQ
jgi:hypothetical protein